MIPVESLIRSLIHELTLSEAHNKSPHFHWKFDQAAVERLDWPNVWTGIEEIGGYFFEIRVAFRYHKSPKKFWVLYVDANILSEAEISGQARRFDGLQLDIKDPPSQADLKEISNLGQRLRSIVETRLSDPDDARVNQLERAVEFNRRLPPWRLGSWRLPGTDARVKGEFLNLGHFQFVVSRSTPVAAFLIARPEFALDGPRQTLRSRSIDSSKIGPTEAKQRIETTLRAHVDLDNHDPDYQRALCLKIIIALKFVFVEDI